MRNRYINRIYKVFCKMVYIETFKKWDEKEYDDDDNLDCECL